MKYPKIGIRPVIDGRWGGVRESLENQTMGMATAAAKLIEEKLCYPDGTPVQCVVSNTTIGGGVRGTVCRRKCYRNAYRYTLLVLRYGNIRYESENN